MFGRLVCKKLFTLRTVTVTAPVGPTPRLIFSARARFASGRPKIAWTFWPGDREQSRRTHPAGELRADTCANGRADSAQIETGPKPRPSEVPWGGAPFRCQLARFAFAADREPFGYPCALAVGGDREANRWLLAGGVVGFHHTELYLSVYM